MNECCKRGHIFIAIFLFLVSFAPRVIGLDTFSTLDESRWLRRSVQFLESVGRGDWAGTMRNSRHTGVTTQWTGALGVLIHYAPQLSFKREVFT
jgi:hypothetical protein